MLLLFFSLLLTTIDPPDARWLDQQRAVISWQQEATDLTCLSKYDSFGRRVYLGCEPGTSGAHQRVLGNPGGDVAWLPEPDDRYWLDFIQGERWTGRSELVTLGDRPVVVWLPLIELPGEAPYLVLE